MSTLSRRRKQTLPPAPPPVPAWSDTEKDEENVEKQPTPPPVVNPKKRNSRSPPSDNDSAPPQPPVRRIRRRLYGLCEIDLRNCDMNDGNGPSHPKSLRRLPSRTSSTRTLYESTEDSENSGVSELKPKVAAGHPKVVLRRLSRSRSNSQPAPPLSELHKSNKDSKVSKLNQTFDGKYGNQDAEMESTLNTTVDGNEDVEMEKTTELKLSKTLGTIQEKETSTASFHDMDVDFVSAESEPEGCGFRDPQSPLVKTEKEAADGKTRTGNKTSPTAAAPVSSSEKLVPDEPKSAQGMYAAGHLPSSPPEAELETPFSNSPAESAEVTVALFDSVLEDRDQTLLCPSNDESDESGISTETEVITQQNDFTIEGLFDWLLPRAAKAKASSQQLLADILQRENIFLILEDRYREILANSYLMDTFSTEELYLSLLTSLKTVVHGELLEITKSYHEVLNILN